MRVARPSFYLLNVLFRSPGECESVMFSCFFCFSLLRLRFAGGEGFTLLYYFFGLRGGTNRQPVRFSRPKWCLIDVIPFGVDFEGKMCATAPPTTFIPSLSRSMSLLSVLFFSSAEIPGRREKRALLPFLFGNS